MSDLLVLPRDTEPSDPQRRELLDSLPGLIQGVVQTVRSTPPTHQAPPPPPARPSVERTERDVAKAQLKEQYFQHADEYLKKGAYGSALVEIRRVKIIAPEDKTALEYERTIRQLVEMQQRAGGQPDGPATRAPEPPLATAEDRPVRTFGDEPAVAAEPSPSPQEDESPAPDSVRSREKWWLIGGLLLGLFGIIGFLFWPASKESPAQEEAVASAAPAATQEKPRAEASPAVHHIPYELDPALTQGDPEPSRGGVERPSGAQRSNTVPVSGPTNAARAEQRGGGGEPVMENRAAGAPVEQAGMAREPQLVRLEKPVFPPEVAATTGGDEVVVMVQIDPDGKPIKTMIAKTSNQALNQSLISAVMKSTFAPGASPTGPATKWLTLSLRINN